MRPLRYELETQEEDHLDAPPHLIAFTGRGDSYCDFMDPLRKQMCAELNVKIRTFEVWQEPRNLELLRKLDGGQCGGVPFFYNRRSGQWICGATTYDNLKDWASGRACEQFLPPPEIEKQLQSKDKGEVQGKLKELFEQVKEKGKKVMDERMQRP